MYSTFSPFGCCEPQSICAQFLPRGLFLPETHQYVKHINQIALWLPFHRFKLLTYIFPNVPNNVQTQKMHKYVQDHFNLVVLPLFPVVAVASRSDNKRGSWRLCLNITNKIFNTLPSSPFLPG